MATLTAQLTATHVYTTIAVTAMPVAVPAGAVVFVSQGLPNVEAFITSSLVSIGDVTIHVNSQMAGMTHLVGQLVTPAYLLTAVGRTLSPIQTQRTKRL